MLELDRIHLATPERALVHALSAQVRGGEVLAVMGPSGSGKSSLLAFVCGTLPAALRAQGAVRLDGRDITALPLAARRVGILFQDDLLFPHMTVLDNLLFALPAGPRAERVARAEAALAEADLAGCGARRPHELSGGQRARVSVLRALLAEPRALLLDEPFSRLDAALRERFRTFVYGRIRALGIPAVLVTHDPQDVPPARRPCTSTPGSAMFDRIALELLKPGITRLARGLAAARVRADHVTVFGFAIGLAGARRHRHRAVGPRPRLLLLSRLCDGLDGALARQTAATDRGAFLDITLDFLFYASIPLAFAIADPAANALAAAVLLAAFVGTGAQLPRLRHAGRASASLHSTAYPSKGLYYLGGLTEGDRNASLCFVLMCLWPAAVRRCWRIRLRGVVPVLTIVTRLLGRLAVPCRNVRHPPSTDGFLRPKLNGYRCMNRKKLCAGGCDRGAHRATSSPSTSGASSAWTFIKAAPARTLPSFMPQRPLLVLGVPSSPSTWR